MELIFQCGSVYAVEGLTLMTNSIKIRKLDKYQKFIVNYIDCICENDCDINKGISDVCWDYTKKCAIELKDFIDEQNNTKRS